MSIVLPNGLFNMLPRTSLRLFLFIVFIGAMVSAKPNRCLEKRLHKDGGTIVEDMGVVECKNGEDICYFYAVYWGTELDGYSQACAKRSIMPNENITITSFTVNDDPTQVCAASLIGRTWKFYCKCEDDLCNDNESTMYQEFMKMYKNITTIELGIVFHSPTLASSSSSTSEKPIVTPPIANPPTHPNIQILDETVDPTIEMNPTATDGPKAEEKPHQPEEDPNSAIKPVMTFVIIMYCLIFV